MWPLGYRSRFLQPYDGDIWGLKTMEAQLLVYDVVGLVINFC